MSNIRFWFFCCTVQLDNYFRWCCISFDFVSHQSNFAKVFINLVVVSWLCFFCKGLVNKSIFIFMKSTHERFAISSWWLLRSSAKAKFIWRNEHKKLCQKKIIVLARIPGRTFDHRQVLWIYVILCLIMPWVQARGKIWAQYTRLFRSRPPSSSVNLRHPLSYFAVRSSQRKNMSLIY